MRCSFTKCVTIVVQEVRRPAQVAAVHEHPQSSTHCVRDHDIEKVNEFHGPGRRIEMFKLKVPQFIAPLPMRPTSSTEHTSIDSPEASTIDPELKYAAFAFGVFCPYRTLPTLDTIKTVWEEREAEFR